MNRGRRRKNSRTFSKNWKIRNKTHQVWKQSLDFLEWNEMNEKHKVIMIDQRKKIIKERQSRRGKENRSRIRWSNKIKATQRLKLEEHATGRAINSGRREGKKEEMHKRKGELEKERESESRIRS